MCSHPRVAPMHQTRRCGRRWQLIAVALLSACCVGAWAQDLRSSAGSLALEPSFKASTDHQESIAMSCISRWRSQPRDRIAAVYLHAHVNATWRNALLACSIANVLKNLAPYTPTDIYVFARRGMYARVVADLAIGMDEDAEKVCVIPIPEEPQWQHQLPRNTPYLLPNNANRFGEYLVMGQWRLLVPFNIMASLGYPYVLQVDDDLFVSEPFQVNMVAHMQEKGYKIANHRIGTEQEHVVWGLPEMARFFLASNSIQPKSSLFAHVHPPSMAGLHTPRIVKGVRGYDQAMLWGNFLVISTDLWREPAVQDWVALCLASGGLERHRWQEQGVMAFIWLMFTDEHELWELKEPEFHYVHGRRANVTTQVCGYDVWAATKATKGNPLLLRPGNKPKRHQRRTRG